MGEASRGPVWVAGASVVVAALSFVPGAREWVYSRLGSVGRYLTGETPVPRLVVGLLVLAAAPSLWPVFRAVWGMRRSYRREYRSGVEMGVMWRWDYSTVDGSVEGVVPHCLGDDARLEWVESENRGRGGGGLLLVCPVCGKAYGPMPGPPRALLDRVGRRIRYEVVTEGWREGGG